MLTVIKRTGRHEPFNVEKIKRVLANISDERNEPLNEGDLRGITRELESIIDQKASISSKHLYIIIVGILYTQGFTYILESYTRHVSNAWK